MSVADLTCQDGRRRQLIRERRLNGIDSLDVSGTRLCVRFLAGLPPEFQTSQPGTFTPEERASAALARIVFRGGRRIAAIRAVDVDTRPSTSKADEACLQIDVDREGDWSAYTLCLVDAPDGRPTDAPLRSLDPRYACLDFHFREDCRAEVDCRTTSSCEPPVAVAPSISYLARDYTSFRQLMLDRLALTMPEWRERHVPDVGVAIVEVLAYVADHLSYFQDAVSTEQYLDTARQRISVRRHARLVDYAMHEGCNARVFVHLTVGQDIDDLAPSDLGFLTHVAGAPVALRQDALPAAAGSSLVFEPMTPPALLRLRVAHNLIRLYTWGDEGCCLAKGATHATLLDEAEERDEHDPRRCDEPAPAPAPAPCPPEPRAAYYGDAEPVPSIPRRVLDLRPGDLLLFEELACVGTARLPIQNGDGGFDGRTPQPDVDRSHRHVVRLTSVTPGCDALRGNRIVEVAWRQEDALPFSLCVSGVGAPPECDLVRNLAAARGNMVLVDHGETRRDEPLPTVDAQERPTACEDEHDLTDTPRLAGRYRPLLTDAPLTFAEPLAPDASAAACLARNPRAALPALTLLGIPPSADGVYPLFRSSSLRDLERLAASLLAPTEEDLAALRRRLRLDVRTLLDAGQVTAPLLRALDANLRALGEQWAPRADLIDSGRDDAAVVVEVDDEGQARLRFGDGDCGRQVEVGMAFAATYRRGNGRAGLVGPETVRHVVWRQGFNDAIVAVRNPLPSTGALDPEPTADVKMYAPGAFRSELARAVTADDYAALAQVVRGTARDPRIQSAAAALRWTGSWYEAEVALDPAATPDLDERLRAEVERRLQRTRRMGHDLRVGTARAVSLRLRLDLCIARDYLVADVLSAVRDALGSRVFGGGRRGFFHPDNLTFGEAIHVSRIIAAAMEVDGVAEASVAALHRLAEGPGSNPTLADGFLALAPNEIARLDDDPGEPENGVLDFGVVRGGR